MEQENSDCVNIGTPNIKEVKDYFCKISDESTPDNRHPSLENSSGSDESLSDSFKCFLNEVTLKGRAVRTSSQASSTPQQSECDQRQEQSPATVDASIYMKTPGPAESRKYFHKKFPTSQLNETAANSSCEMNPSFEEFLNAKRNHLAMKQGESSVECPSFEQRKWEDSIPSPSPSSHASMYMKTPGVAEARKYFNRKLPTQLNETETNTSAEIDLSFEIFLQKKRERLLKNLKGNVGSDSEDTVPNSDLDQ
jgi:hypothetical protein